MTALDDVNEDITRLNEIQHSDHKMSAEHCVHHAPPITAVEAAGSALTWALILALGLGFTAFILGVLAVIVVVAI